MKNCLEEYRNCDVDEIAGKYITGEGKMDNHDRGTGAYLVRPVAAHKLLYEDMMDEWEAFGGRINPGAIRRYSRVQGKNVTYEEWLEWVKEDREIVQDLFFSWEMELFWVLSVSDMNVRA